LHLQLLLLLLLLLLLRGCSGNGGGTGALSPSDDGGSDGTKTSSLPSEQSSRSLTEMAKFLLRRLSLLSWLR